VRFAGLIPKLLSIANDARYIYTFTVHACNYFEVDLAMESADEPALEIAANGLCGEVVDAVIMRPSKGIMTSWRRSW